MLKRFLYVIQVASTITLCNAITGRAADEPEAKKDVVTHHYFSKSEHQHAAKWGYEGKIGPKFWGDLDPAYRLAKTGKRQSPINIETKVAATKKLPALKFDYQVEQLSSFNNGHTIQHNEAPGSFLFVGDDRYALEQLHVHTPSEHTIDGKHFPMEIHLVHKSGSGRIAVVAVLVEAKEKGTVEVPFYFGLPSRSGEEVRYEGRRNPSDFLPQSRKYFEYSGSFTTPPCTEDVRWIVMQQPVRANPKLIHRFETLLKANNRPTKPLNGRVVGVSE